MRPQVKSTVIFSILGLSLALNIATVPWSVRGLARGTAEDDCLLDRLDLDAEQQRRLAAMRRKMLEKRRAYQQRAAAIKTALAEEISTAPKETQALSAQLERYVANQAAMQREVAKHLLGVRAMLRPDQREAFEVLLRDEMFRGIDVSRSTAVSAP